MIINKIYENDENIFSNPEDAIEYMKENDFRYGVHVYAIKEKDAYEKTKPIYAFIKEYNKGKPLDEQILPGTQYAYQGILGCLGVHVYEISLGKYKDNHNCLCLFGEFKKSVLDTSKGEADVRPGTKALTTLAMMGMMCHGL